VGCAETQEMLDAYLDGELDLIRSLEMERHLAGCPACANAFASLQALQEAIRSAPLRHAPPRRLESRIRLALRKETAPRRSLIFAVSGGLAAAMLLLALGGWLWLRTGVDPIVHEVAAAHIHSLLADHFTDVLSTDRHTVKPWFTGKLDYAPPVPDISDRGFSLAGGRLDYLDGRPVAALVYERRKHIINLFVWPAPDGGTREPALLKKQGYSLIHWREGGMNWWAVSDLNAEELRDFVASIRG
jgi:anti-sigma factor RsiW